jgi:hypothetical protein
MLVSIEQELELFKTGKGEGKMPDNIAGFIRTRIRTKWYLENVSDEELVLMLISLEQELERTQRSRKILSMFINSGYGSFNITRIRTI